MKIRDSWIFLRCLICFSAFWMNMPLATSGLPKAIQYVQVFNWEDLRAPYDTYINCPSPENAKALLNALPVNRPIKETGDSERVMLYIFGGANFPVLSNEVRAGEKSAVEIMVRLLNITDGAYSDTVETELAGLIRNKPQLFLEVLLANKDQEYIKRFGFPVDFVGEGYQAHPCALKHEYEKRIEALEGVKVPIYDEIIRSCMMKLHASIKELTQKVP
jgi:hypothetical protein